MELCLHTYPIISAAELSLLLSNLTMEQGLGLFASLPFYTRDFFVKTYGIIPALATYIVARPNLVYSAEQCLVI